MKNSSISWTTSTFNPWLGCQKISEGCRNCYAETLLDQRYGRVKWGPTGERQLTSDANWRNPVKWNREAEASGLAHFVFCSSLCDVMDDKAPSGARERLWELVYSTPSLTWLLLSKRPQNFSRFLPWGNHDMPWPNCWLGVSAENVKRAQERIPVLLKTPAVVRFISAEPLLEDISGVDLSGIDWTIIGGESGSNARPMDIEWARSLKIAAKKAGSQVWMKQAGEVWSRENRPRGDALIQIEQQTGEKWSRHGANLSQWPAAMHDLRVQQWPTSGGINVAA